MKSNILLYLQNLAIFIDMILSFDVFVRDSIFFYKVAISFCAFINFTFNFLTLRLYSSLVFGFFASLSISDI